MWFDIGGWWLTCGYMYRRFGVPFGKDWVAKTVNGYLMSAVVPRPAEEEAELWAYYNMVMPVYADKFLDWWKRRYLPEILRNFEYLDTFPMETSSLPELMILLEEAHRHPGTPLAAALDAQPRAVPGVHHLRERPHSADRRAAQAARRPHSHL